MTEKIAPTILSLPMYPQLTRSEQENIAQAMRECLAVGRKMPSPKVRARNRRLTVWQFSEGSSSQRALAALQYDGL